jgi:glycosyltransferase involved in cell wall biosynthesis
MLQTAKANITATRRQKFFPASQCFISHPPSPRCEVCITIPVRNEAETLEKTLSALAQQVDLKGVPLDKDRYEVLVLANNCDDDSALIARRFSQTDALNLQVAEITLPPFQANVGYVRRLLMNEAWSRFHHLGCPQGILATTDGDTQVSPTWVAAIIAEIKKGVDGVGGRIFTKACPQSGSETKTRSRFLRYVTYNYLTAQLEGYLDPDPFDPFPRHHQHYGASFALTAQIYAKVGGMPTVRQEEDVALYKVLQRVDARFRHSPMVQVVTSNRTQGRTQGGLAQRLTQMEKLVQQQQQMQVEGIGLLKSRFFLRSQLRWWWQDGIDSIQPAVVAERLGLSLAWLTMAVNHSRTFGLLLDRIYQQQQHHGYYLLPSSTVEIEHAIAQLRQEIRCLQTQQPLQPCPDIQPILLFPPSF